MKHPIIITRNGKITSRFKERLKVKAHSYRKAGELLKNGDIKGLEEYINILNIKDK